MTLKDVTPRLWASAFTVGLSSLLFGYCLACLNTVITCPSKPCPKGSILADMELSLGTCVRACVRACVYGSGGVGESVSQSV